MPADSPDPDPDPDVDKENALPEFSSPAEGAANIKSEQEAGRSVARNTALMTIGTLLSRLTGLGRTWIMAYALGAGMLASAYQVANNLPNIIYETIAGGMIAAAFLPVLMLVAESGGKQAENRYASNILNIVAVALGAISLAGIVFAEQLVATQTFTVMGTGNEVVEQSVWLFRIFSVQVLFYGLSGIVQGMLNANRTFFITAFAPALNNITVIASFVAYSMLASTSTDVALWVLAAGTTAGVIVQFAVQLPAVKKQGFKWQPILDFRDPTLAETVKIAVPTVVFVFASIVGQSARNAFSLGASDSGPAMIQYAWLWFQLPYGVIAVSLARTMFTEMSDAAAKGDMRLFREFARKGLVQTLCLMIPCAFLLYALSDPLVGIFQSGAFTSEDRAVTASLLRIWAIGLPVYSIWCYLYNAFASLRRFLPFAVLNVCLTAAQVALYWVATSSPLGLLGIPVADVIYYAAYAVGAIVLVKKVIDSYATKEQLATWTNAEGNGVPLSLFRRSDGVDVTKVALAGLVSACVLLGASCAAPTPDGLAVSLVEVVVGGAAGLFMIVGLSLVMKVGALAGAYEKLRSKMRRQGT